MTKRIFYKNKAVIIIILVILIIAGSVAVGNRAFSYNDTITHPSLTGNIAKIYNANSELKLTEQEIGWLKQGSIEEDRAPRWMNHFYDPIADVGLPGGFSSKIWAGSPFLQIREDGDNQTWQRAIDSYADGDRKSAFIALGHVLHLLEDATVPAHTRLDAHPTGDPYEVWVRDNIGLNINFDSTPNKVDSLDQIFYDLAKYSNNYFLSKNTVDLNKLKNVDNFKKIKDGVVFNCKEIVGNESFCLITFETAKTGEIKYVLDSPIVHSDYFSLLAPKAVSYGAGAVKLFFDEAEKKKKEYEQKSWWEKLKDSVNQLLAGFSGEIYAGISSEEIAPSPAQRDSAPEVVATPTPSAVPLPSNTVEAREKIEVNLPPDTVAAQEKLGGDIKEEVNPQNSKIPPAIVEEIIPGQAKLPATSPTPLTFLPGMSGPTPTPSPSPNEPDTTAPETIITSAPAASVATTTAVFIFTSSESDSTFECQLDGAATSSCVSPKKEYADLSEGSHIFKVRATDAAGNSNATSTAEHSWVIDLTAPQLSGIASTPGRTSALISWTTSEAGIFQIEYGTSTSYDLTSATTSAISLSINSLTASTTYHFRILAQDNLDNATSTADYTFTTTSQAENVVISEIQIGGATANDEFVELYNPTLADINLSGWRLTKKSDTGLTTNNLLTSFPDKTISAKGYFLIAHPTGYDGGALADAVYSTSASIAPNNSIILYYSDVGRTIIDMVGLGTSTISETVTIDNPSNNQSIERKAFSNSTSTTMFSGADKWQGNGYDSDNNSQDFVLQLNPSPQNSLMLTEPRVAPPNLMTASSWPTWQGNLARTGLSSVNSLATSTMRIKWSVATSSSAGFTFRPVLDNENNVYIGMANGLAKFSASDGSLLWRYATSSAVMVSPLITDDNTIYFRGGGSLFAISSSGQLKWVYYLPGTAAVNAALAILSDGTIITQLDEKIYAINQDATLKWIFDPDPEIRSPDSITAPVVDMADNIYIAIDGYLYMIDKTGIKIWEKNLIGCSGVSLGNDSTLYVATRTAESQGAFLALDSASGAEKWRDAIAGYNDHAKLAPAIDSSGQVYTIMFYYGGIAKLRSYNASSTPIWTSGHLGSAYLAAPIVTADGKIYLAAQNNLQVFDAISGALIYSFDSGDNLFYNYFGAVASDGTIYSATPIKLYAIGN